MDSSKNKTSRRELLSKIFKGTAFIGLGGTVWGSWVKKSKASDLILRPPGAIDEDEFLKKCLRCGECVNACPYDVLKLAEPTDRFPIGTPYFIPRKNPCSMCPDVPCVPVCPSGSLKEENLFDEKQEMNIEKAEMGIAVIDQNACLAFWGIQCDVCYRACPLIDNAITIKREKSEVTLKHSKLLPVINIDACTGCGVCEHACVTEKAAIFILPKKIALGEVGSHYIKGWDEKDERRMDQVQELKEGGQQKAIDYLNSDDF